VEGDRGGFFVVFGFGEDFFDEVGGGVGVVAVALDDFGDSQAADAAGVVGLVVAVGHDEHGLAGAENLGGGAHSALVDDERGAGEEPGVGRVGGDANVGRNLVRGLVARVTADEQDGALVELFGGEGALFVEVAGIEDRGGTQREDERRGPGLEEGFEVGGEVEVAGVRVIEDEAAGLGGGRPVGLGLA